jgi:hypothetical protein
VAQVVVHSSAIGEVVLVEVWIAATAVALAQDGDFLDQINKDIRVALPASITEVVAQALQVLKVSVVPD